MTLRYRVAVAASVATATALLGACSSGTTTADARSDSSAGSATETDVPAAHETASVPAGGPICSADATPAPTPYSDKTPSSLPLPPDTVIYNVDDRGNTGVVLTGVSAQPLDTVRDFMNTAWPKAGYKLLEGETEELDAESNWVTAGFTGRWAIKDLGTECPGETFVQVLSDPS